jgi:hypothetical protein
LIPELQSFSGKREVGISFFDPIRSRDAPGIVKGEDFLCFLYSVFGRKQLSSQGGKSPGRYLKNPFFHERRRRLFPVTENKQR